MFYYMHYLIVFFIWNLMNFKCMSLEYSFSTL